MRIFGTMINQKLQDFEEEVKAIGNVVTEATLDVYNTVAQRFLPTPARIHYLFNLRDISKVRARPHLPPGPASTDAFAPQQRPRASAQERTTPRSPCPAVLLPRFPLRPGGVFRSHRPHPFRRCSRACSGPTRTSTTPSPASHDSGSMSVSGEMPVPRPRLDRCPRQMPDAGLPSLVPSSGRRALSPAFPGLSPLPANRVFSDRLVDAADMEAFVGIISDKLGSFFDLTFHNLCPSKRSPIFGELVSR